MELRRWKELASFPSEEGKYSKRCGWEVVCVERSDEVCVSFFRPWMYKEDAVQRRKQRPVWDTFPNEKMLLGIKIISNYWCIEIRAGNVGPPSHATLNWFRAPLRRHTHTHTQARCYRNGGRGGGVGADLRGQRWRRGRFGKGGRGLGHVWRTRSDVVSHKPRFWIIVLQIVDTLF